MQANEKENAKRRLIPTPYVSYICCLGALDHGRNFQHGDGVFICKCADKWQQCWLPISSSFKIGGGWETTCNGRRGAETDGLMGRISTSCKHFGKTRWVGSLKSPTGSTLLCQTCAFVMSLLSLASQLLAFCPATVPALHHEQPFVPLKAESRVMKSIKNVGLSFRSQLKKPFFFSFFFLVAIRFRFKMLCRDISSAPSDF